MPTLIAGKILAIEAAISAIWRSLAYLVSRSCHGFYPIREWVVGSLLLKFYIRTRWSDMFLNLYRHWLYKNKGICKVPDIPSGRDLYRRDNKLYNLLIDSMGEYWRFDEKLNPIYRWEDSYFGIDLNFLSSLLLITTRLSEVSLDILVNNT